MNSRLFSDKNIDFRRVTFFSGSPARDQGF